MQIRSRASTGAPNSATGPNLASGPNLMTGLTGTAAIAFILCCSRWGTTIGVGPIYLSDALIFVAVLNAAFTHRPRGAYGGFLQRPAPSVPVVFWLFLAYTVVRFVTSYGNGPLLDWVRDAVPYLYGFVALASAASFAGATVQRRARTARILTAALVLHLAWTAVMVLTPLGLSLNLVVPLAQSPLFQVRPDIDSALNAVLAGICLRAAVRGSHRVIALVGLVAASGLVLSLATRAGTISLFVVLAISFGLSYSHVARASKKRVWLILAGVLVVLIAGIVLPSTTPGQRIIATLVPGSAVTDQQLNAEGTAKARDLVWSGVIHWTLETPGRAVVGGGFGNDFLQQSGTLAYLEGTTYTGVRSPHDWFIGTFARMGFVGVGLAALSVLLGLLTIWRRRREIAADPLAPTAAAIVVAIIPIASLGVVLEAPFGAIPFFWSLGVIYAFRSLRPTDSGAHRTGGRRTMASRTRTAALARGRTSALASQRRR